MGRKRTLLGLAVLLLSICAVVFAQSTQQGPGQGQWRHRGPHGPGGMLAHLTRVLNLTDAQQAQVKTMWESEKPNVVPLFQQLEQGHKEMLGVTANGAFDEAKVNSIAQQQSQTLAKLIVEKEKLQSKFYQILTPEQRTRFTQMQQRHDQHIERMLLRFGQ